MNTFLKNKKIMDDLLAWCGRNDIDYPYTYAICREMPEDDCQSVCPLAKKCNGNDNEREAYAKKLIDSGRYELY